MVKWPFGSKPDASPRGQEEASALVPKIIHQFWDKPTPPPDVVERMDTWPERHPGWRYIRWNDETAADFILAQFGREAALCFLASIIPAMRADIARIAALVTYGGMFVEADWGCARTLDDFLIGHGTLRYGPGRGEGEAATRIRLSTGFIASEPNSPLLTKAWSQILANVKHSTYSLQISKMTGPGMLTAVWYGRLSEKERSLYRLILKADFADYITRPGAPEYRKDGNHWLTEIERRKIINFAAAEAALGGPAASDLPVPD